MKNIFFYVSTLIFIVLSSCAEKSEDLFNLSEGKITCEISISKVTRKSALVSVQMKEPKGKNWDNFPLIDLNVSSSKDMSDAKGFNYSYSLSDSYDGLYVFEITNLSAGNTYYYEVVPRYDTYYATVGSLSLKFSDFINGSGYFTTNADTTSLPIAFETNQTGSNSMEITMLTPDNLTINSSTKIYYKTDDDESYQVVKVYSTASKLFKLTNLKPEKYYTFYFSVSGSIKYDNETEYISDLNVSSDRYSFILLDIDYLYTLSPKVSSGIQSALVNLDIEPAPFIDVDVALGSSSITLKYWKKNDSPSNYTTKTSYDKSWNLNNLEFDTEYEYQFLSVPLIIDYWANEIRETLAETQVYSFKTRAIEKSATATIEEILPNKAKIKITLPDNATFNETPKLEFRYKSNTNESSYLFRFNGTGRSSDGRSYIFYADGLTPYTSYVLTLTGDILIQSSVYSETVKTYPISNSELSTPSLASNQEIINGVLAISLNGCTSKWAFSDVNADWSDIQGSLYYWGSKFSSDKSEKDINSLPNNIAGTIYDVASYKMGSNWMIPSQDQWQELLNNTTRTYEKDLKAIRFTDSSGHSILIPCGGMKPSYYANLLKPGDMYVWTSIKEGSGSNSKGIALHIPVNTTTGVVGTPEFIPTLGLCQVRGVTSK